MSAKKIATTAMILAICIAVQFFKNVSVYITGPVVNLCLILLTLVAGLIPGIILSIITPITAFFITGSPITAAVPSIIPMIMIGNIILVVAVGIFNNKIADNRLIIPMIIGSIAKAIFMGITISLIIVPNFLPEKMMKMMPVIQMTFSITQLNTAIIGSIIAYFIWKPIKNTLNN